MRIWKTEDKFTGNWCKKKKKEERKKNARLGRKWERKEEQNFLGEEPRSPSAEMVKQKSGGERNREGDSSRQ